MPDYNLPLVPIVDDWLDGEKMPAGRSERGREGRVNRARELIGARLVTRLCAQNSGAERLAYRKLLHSLHIAAFTGCDNFLLWNHHESRCYWVAPAELSYFAVL
jgi:hypothetical protein